MRLYRFGSFASISRRKLEKEEPFRVCSHFQLMILGKLQTEMADDSIWRYADEFVISYG